MNGNYIVKPLFEVDYISEDIVGSVSDNGSQTIYIQIDMRHLYLNSDGTTISWKNQNDGKVSVRSLRIFEFCFMNLDFPLDFDDDVQNQISKFRDSIRQNIDCALTVRGIKLFEYECKDLSLHYYKTTIARELIQIGAKAVGKFVEALYFISP